MSTNNGPAPSSPRSTPSLAGAHSNGGGVSRGAEQAPSLFSSLSGVLNTAQPHLDEIRKGKQARFLDVSKSDSLDPESVKSVKARLNVINDYLKREGKPPLFEKDLDLTGAQAGVFTPEMQNAVKAFQSRYGITRGGKLIEITDAQRAKGQGLKVDGVVGNWTLTALDAGMELVEAKEKTREAQSGRQVQPLGSMKVAMSERMPGLNAIKGGVFVDDSGPSEYERQKALENIRATQEHRRRLEAAGYDREILNRVPITPSGTMINTVGVEVTIPSPTDLAWKVRNNIQD